MESTLHYTLEPGELADAMAQHLPNIRSAARRARVALALFAAAFLALASLSSAMLVPFAATVVAAVNAPSMLRRQALRAVARTSAMTEPMSVTADSEGVEITTEMSRLWYSWRNYESVVSSPAGLGLIGRGGTILRWIPARAFSSDDERERWATLARQGVTTP